MTDSIYVLHADNTLIQVSQAPYALESDIQKLLDRYPELLPGAQINPESPRRWLVIRSEAGVPAEEGGSEQWSVDHLLVDQDGVPTIVEVKRATDTRIRREVVAQMLEYAANGTAYWRMETLRGWFEGSSAVTGQPAEERLHDFLGDGGLDPDAFWARVEENLQAGRVRCVFVADVIPPTLRRLVEFLNEHLDTVEVLAVELPQYVAADQELRAIVPRLVGQTARAVAAKGTPPRSGVQWNEERFRSAVVEGCGPEDLAVFESLLRWCREYADDINWGKGASWASMIAIVVSAGNKQKPFTVWVEGPKAGVEIGFEYLRTRAPFEDEALRFQLLDRLNAIPGVNIGLDRATKRPSIPFAVLRSQEAQEQFFSTMLWVIQTIRAAQ